MAFCIEGNLFDWQNDRGTISKIHFTNFTTLPGSISKFDIVVLNNKVDLRQNCKLEIV